MKTDTHCDGYHVRSLNYLSDDGIRLAVAVFESCGRTEGGIFTADFVNKYADSAFPAGLTRLAMDMRVGRTFERAVEVDNHIIQLVRGVSTRMYEKTKKLIVTPGRLETDEYAEPIKTRVAIPDSDRLRAAVTSQSDFGGVRAPAVASDIEQRLAALELALLEGGAPEPFSKRKFAELEMKNRQQDLRLDMSKGVMSYDEARKEEDRRRDAREPPFDI